MKAMLYADWMNLRRSMKAILIVVAVIAVASLTWENMRRSCRLFW